jgi:hypothetical protein
VLSQERTNATRNPQSRGASEALYHHYHPYLILLHGDVPAWKDVHKVDVGTQSARRSGSVQEKKRWNREYQVILALVQGNWFRSEDKNTSWLILVLEVGCSTLNKVYMKTLEH